MASAPNVLNPQEWLPFLWGGEETAPFSDGEQLELYIDEIVQMWNQTRPALLEGSWQWPEGCTLDEQDIVSASTRDFCEGVLQGWQLTRDDWETLMPEDSEDSAYWVVCCSLLLCCTIQKPPLQRLQSKAWKA